jgi:hypothetical protein
MRHDVSLTMCFHTLWCRLYQTSEFSASCRPRPRARAVAAVAAGPCRRRGGTGGERACVGLCRRIPVRYTILLVLRTETHQ